MDPEDPRMYQSFPVPRPEHCFHDLVALRQQMDLSHEPLDVEKWQVVKNLINQYFSVNQYFESV